MSTRPSALPTLHSTWLRALTGIDGPPSEPKATCGDCIMCAGAERSGTDVRFSPDVKCCSYVPHLANFVAGQSLVSSGRTSIAARIAGRAGVTPLGLGLSQRDIRRLLGAQSEFGRSTAVVCPHFDADTNGCAIWKTRNAVCSTWFCKHERGAVSQRFWSAVRDLLIATEERVARDCLDRGGLPGEQVHAVLEHRAGVRAIIARANRGESAIQIALDDESPDWYARMWGDWAGREEAWFVRCADSVSPLDDDGLVSLMNDVGDLSQAVRDRWAELTTRQLPDRPTFRPGAGSEATADMLRLVGYSPFDPLVLPATLQSTLHRLDGRPISRVRREFGAHGDPLEADILQLLCDFEIAHDSEARQQQSQASTTPVELAGDAPALIDLTAVEEFTP